MASQSFSAADLLEVVKLLAAVGEPEGATPLTARKHAFALGLAELVRADTYVWSIGVVDPASPGDAMPTAFVDGGWLRDEERVEFFGAIINSPWSKSLAIPMTECVQKQKARTYLRQDVIGDDDWEQPNNDVRRIGFAESLFSLYPMESGGFSAIGLHRRIGKPPYTERERGLVHIVFQNVPWIHRAGLNVPSGQAAVQLGRRPREVLLLLLHGESVKRIASKLRISSHTVNDYTKQIYRQFAVSSRGQLLALFISGGG